MHSRIPHRYLSALNFIGLKCEVIDKHSEIPWVFWRRIKAIREVHPPIGEPHLEANVFNPIGQSWIELDRITVFKDIA